MPRQLTRGRPCQGAEGPRRIRAPCRRSGNPLAATNGRIKPIGRHLTDSAELERVAFRLERGAVSPPIETSYGIMIARCLRRIPADTQTKFDDVRGSLERQVRQQRMQQGIATAFKELREQAGPRLLWQPPADAASPRLP